MPDATVGGVFDGCGLLAYGLHLAGWEHRWLCEVDQWRRELLGIRWPGVPIVGDVRAVGSDSVPRVELIAGGFPCKGASTAGLRNGFDHPETVLWREMARAIRELRPRYVLVENVANILAIRDGAVWGEVVGDLAALGFDIQWDCFPAAAFGAPHLRDRVIAIATHPDGCGWGSGECDLRQRQPDAQRGAATPAGAAAPDPDDEGRDGRAERDDQAARGLGTQHDAVRLGVRVEWGLYEAAVRRWEEVVGQAPEPLCAFRGVDARAAARVERSRLSALGDGVQVQLGRLAGEYLMAQAIATPD